MSEMIVQKRTRYSEEPQTRADVFLIGAGLSRALGAEMPLVRQLTAAVATDLEDRGLKALLATVPFATSDFERPLPTLLRANLG
jgi:hypothetical protein